MSLRRRTLFVGADAFVIEGAHAESRRLHISRSFVRTEDGTYSFKVSLLDASADDAGERRAPHRARSRRRRACAAPGSVRRRVCACVYGGGAARGWDAGRRRSRCVDAAMCALSLLTRPPLAQPRAAGAASAWRWTPSSACSTSRRARTSRLSRSLRSRRWGRARQRCARARRAAASRAVPIRVDLSCI